MDTVDHQEDMIVKSRIRFLVVMLSAGAFLSAIYKTPNVCKIGNAANMINEANKNPYTMFVNNPAVM